MNRIKEIRKQKSLTLKEVAEKANTSVQQVQRLERGDRRLTTEWIERLSNALNCTGADIVPDLAVDKNDTFRQLEADYLSLNEENRKELENFIGFLKAKENK